MRFALAIPVVVWTLLACADPATIGEHRIICDQYVSDGGHGNDEGVTPPELLLASLGACAGHYAAEYLRARSLP